MKLFLNSTIMFLVSFLYASLYWLGEDNFLYLEREISIGTEKPYVYRQLIPFLVRSLSSLGFRDDWVLCILVALCGVGFYLSTRNIVLHYNVKLSSLEETFILGTAIIGLCIFGNFRHSYDLPTAFLFSLSILFMIRGEVVKYLVIFPVAVINRETSILLIIIFCMYFGLKYLEVLYQICAFGAIQLFIRLVFWNNSGDVALVEPIQNIARFINNPERTIIHLSIVVVLIILSVWNRNVLEKRVFVFLASALFVMYLILGQAFEVRVFWEVYPMTVVLSHQTLKEIYNAKRQTSKNPKVQSLQPTQNRF